MTKFEFRWKQLLRLEAEAGEVRKSPSTTWHKRTRQRKGIKSQERERQTQYDLTSVTQRVTELSLSSLRETNKDRLIHKGASIHSSCNGDHIIQLIVTVQVAATLYAPLFPE